MEKKGIRILGIILSIVIFLSCQSKETINLSSTYPSQNETISTNKIELLAKFEGDLRKLEQLKVKLNDNIVLLTPPKKDISVKVELINPTNQVEYILEYKDGSTQTNKVTFFYIPKEEKAEIEKGVKKLKVKYKPIKVKGIKKYQEIKPKIVLPEIQMVKESIYISNIQLEILNQEEYLKNSLTITYKVNLNEEFKIKSLDVIKEITLEITDPQDKKLFYEKLKEPMATFDLDISTLPTGPYILSIKVEDVSNRKYEESKWVKVDKTPPSIILSEISNNTIVRGTFDFYATIVDEESGLDNFEAEIDSKKIPYSKEGQKVKFFIDSQSLKNGVYTIKIVASDKLTNTTKTNIKVLVDNWIEKIVDPNLGAGFNVSSFIDSESKIHLAYYNIVTKNLYYAITKDLTNWEIELVDKEKDSGKYPSIFVDNFNRIHIAYTFINEKWDDEDLRYALKEGATWKVETLDQQDKAGRYTSITVDNRGIPHISYYNFSVGGLRYITYNLKMERWEVSVPDSLENVGSDTSIAIHSNVIHIVYLDNANGNLKHCWKGIEESDANWKFEVIDSEGKVGYYASMKIDKKGNIHVAYYDSTQKVLKYAIKVGNSWEIKIVDRKDDPGRYTSIFIDSKDNPHISYFVESKKEIRYAYFDGEKWDIQTATSKKAGGYSSLIIFKDKPVIFFYDQINNKLKLVTK